jgi:acyl-CoA thioesterase-1
MNWLIFHVASGQAFFSGAALVVAGCLLSMWDKPRAKRGAVLLVVLGVLAAGISSTPLPWFANAALLLGLVAAPVLLRRLERKQLAPLPLIAACLLAAVCEAPYHFPSRLRPAKNRSVAIVGDSLTAGMGARETKETWPRILDRERLLDVCDLSQAGDTTGKAHRHMEAEPPIAASVVIVELGGNDVLGPTTVKEFAHDLDVLLGLLTAADRQIVMFELPLPPGAIGYGYVQRRLARKHGVVLIPKRHLMAILADSAATVDTIHLTTAGHRRMADLAWERIRDAFPD